MGFLDKAKDLASKNSDKVSQGLDKAKDMADEKTGGKYSDQIDKAAGMAGKQLGVDEVEDEAVVDGDVVEETE